MLVLGRDAFYRPTSILAERFTPVWIVSVAGVVAASAWIGISLTGTSITRTRCGGRSHSTPMRREPCAPCSRRGSRDGLGATQSVAPGARRAGTRERRGARACPRRSFRRRATRSRNVALTGDKKLLSARTEGLPHVPGRGPELDSARRPGRDADARGGARVAAARAFGPARCAGRVLPGERGDALRSMWTWALPRSRSARKAASRSAASRSRAASMRSCARRSVARKGTERPSASCRGAVSGPPTGPAAHLGRLAGGEVGRGEALLARRISRSSTSSTSTWRSSKRKAVQSPSRISGASPRAMSSPSTSCASRATRRAGRWTTSSSS
jgi:hypothetical protein